MPEMQLLIATCACENASRENRRRATARAGISGFAIDAETRVYRGCGDCDNSPGNLAPIRGARSAGRYRLLQPALTNLSPASIRWELRGSHVVGCRTRLPNAVR